MSRKVISITETGRSGRNMSMLSADPVAFGKLKETEPIRNGQYISNKSLSLKVDNYANNPIYGRGDVTSFYHGSIKDKHDADIPVRFSEGKTYIISDTPEPLPVDLDKTKMIEEPDFRKVGPGCKVLLEDNEGAWIRFSIYDDKREPPIYELLRNALLLNKPVKMYIENPLA